MYLDSNSGGVLFQILLVCLVIGVGVTILMVKRKPNLNQKNKFGSSDSKVISHSGGGTASVSSVLSRILFVITVIAIGIDVFFATSATLEYANHIKQIREKEKQCEQTTGADAVFCGAALSLTLSSLSNAWHTKYPTSNGRLLIYIPLFLAGIALLFWQYHVRKILALKKNCRILDNRITWHFGDWSYEDFLTCPKHR